MTRDNDSFAHGLLGVVLDGRYRLDAVLGEGGMGTVFRATQLAMDRRVAVKLLKPHLSNDQAALQRFVREARATYRVESPHAVKILDFGVTPLSDYYIVLEYLDGRTVQRELEIDGAFAPARVAHIAIQALDALGVAHGHGLVHRDIKPDNLLLMRQGGDPDYTKILDFGVAKLMQGAADPHQLALTAAGMVFGTPEYMSPEQACGQTLDGRSDLYSLAVAMFVMLTAAPLFEGETALDWLTHHVRTPAPRLAMARPALAAVRGIPALDDLLQRCLAKQRDDRPASAAEMARLIAELAPALGADAAPGPAGAGPGAPGLLGGSGAGPGPVAEIRPVGAPGRAPGIGRGLAGPAAPPRLPTGADAMPTAGSQTRTSSYVAAWRDPADAPVGPAAAIALGSVDARGAPGGRAGFAAATGRSPQAARMDPRPQASAGPRRRSRLAIGLIGVALASLVGLVVGVAMAPSSPPGAAPRGSAPDPAEPGRAGSGAANPGTVPGPVAPVLARPVAVPGPASTAVAAAAIPASTGSAAHGRSPGLAPGPAAVPGRPAPGVSGRVAAAEQHLRSAEDAFRAHSHLRQLAEADLALRADPRSERAKYLLGDALIESGDLDRGCTYLRALTRYPPARARSRAASCPGD